QYIRFNLIKQTESPLIAFLYHWEVDQIEYSDKETFDQMVKGLIQKDMLMSFFLWFIKKNQTACKILEK
ncbi:hypothetical protein GMA81_10210, partial [Turicibacter sanguinis]|nr:hypothetical protein [Turicibacter sanguinis]